MAHVKNGLGRRLVPVAILGMVVALFFSPALLQTEKIIWLSSPLGSDISYRHWPDMIGYAASWREGRIDLWDPLTALGRPLPGDSGVLFLYPFDLLFLGLPPALAFNVFDAIHVFLAGLFTYLLLHMGYHVSQPAALMSGLAFAFMPKLIAHLAGGHVGVLAALAWAPAVLLSLKLAIEGSLVAAALAGLALALQVPTHVQEPYYTAALGGALWLWHLAPPLWRGLRGEAVAWKKVRHLFSVLILWLISFGALAAVVLLPLLELLPYNSRTAFTLADANVYALPPTLLLTLFAPIRFQLSEWVIFLGTLPLLLGLLGLIKSTSHEKWLLAALTGFSLIYALGTATPLFGIAFFTIPGFRLLRVPTRLWFFAGLAVAVLAGLGVEQLASAELREKLWQQRRFLVQAAGIYFVGGLTGLITYRVIFQHWHWLLIFQLFTSVLIVTAFSLWLLTKLTGRALQWILIPLLLLDLLPLDASYIDLIDPRSKFMQPTPEFDFVSRQPGLFRVYSPLGTLPFALAAERRVEILEGLLAFQISHSVEAIREATGCSKSGYATSVPLCLDDIEIPSGTPNAKKLGDLNVRYLVTPQDLSDPNFRLAFSATEKVYENLLWQPRARLSPEGQAYILARRPGEYDLSLTAIQPGSLILSETWLPGWQATLDGKPVSTARIEGALIGVTVPAGEHTLHLKYDPLGWQIGWRISALALVGLGVWLVVTIVKGLRQGRA